IHDRPYEEITAAAASLARHASTRTAAAPRADASVGVPRAPDTPLNDLKSMLALKPWDRERGFVRPASRFPVADLYLCWAPEAVYAGLYAIDTAEDSYYIHRKVPEADRMEWLVRVNESRAPIRARLGAGRAPAVSPGTATVLSPGD